MSVLLCLRWSFESRSKIYQYNESGGMSIVEEEKEEEKEKEREEERRKRFGSLYFIANDIWFCTSRLDSFVFKLCHNRQTYVL